MSYPAVWNISYRDLQKTGFIALLDQAWAGAKDQKELESAFVAAKRFRLSVVIPILRNEVDVKFRYSHDFSFLKDRDFGFLWSYIPFTDLRENEDVRNIPGNRRAGYGFFRTEADAVAWKLSISQTSAGRQLHQHHH